METKRLVEKDPVQKKDDLIVITGEAGLMGSLVCNELLCKQHRVIALDDLSGGFVENVPKEAVFVKGLIADAALIQRLFAEHRFDYVFHLAVSNAFTSVFADTGENMSLKPNAIREKAETHEMIPRWVKALKPLWLWNHRLNDDGQIGATGHE
jgi:NAD dependent epimerase/dehydratase family enzyme